MGIEKVSIKGKLVSIAVLSLIGSLAILLFSLRAIHSVKIRGPLYTEIILYKDLLADILPPPEYLIESYLTCFELERAKPEERPRLFQKLAKLESDYTERHAYWIKNLKNHALRETMLNEAAVNAKKFFAVVDSSYIPLLRANRDAEAQRVLDRQLTPLYGLHRAAIDKTVALANREVDRVEAKADAGLSGNMRFLYASAFLVNAILLFLTFLAIRSILGPLKTLMRYALRVGEGDYTAVCGVREKSEIGQLADVLCKTVHRVNESIEKVGQSEHAAEEEANNARRAQEATQTAMGKTEQKAAAMLQAAEGLEKSVEILDGAGKKLSARIAESAQGSKTQSERIAETATAMEEMNATVLEVAKNASEAADSAAKTRANAEEGAAIVSQVIAGIGSVQNVSATMKEDISNLGKQAENIGQILDVISDIADQTNLLALNAAIEAARAGDAGRGFAVVADEVRKLAEKTMAATKEVDEAIRGIQAGAQKNIANMDEAVADVAQATALADKSGAALQAIVQMAENSSDQVRSIATASEEQSATSEEISTSIDEINRIAGNTTEAMDRCGAAIDELTDQTHALRGLIKELEA